MAERISQWNRVDIFKVGTGLAGSSNVRREVGRISGMVTFLCDTSKGVFVILLAESFGLEGLWLLVPGTFAVGGHWYSIFTKFRGGDGVAVLGGIMVALFTGVGLISLGVAMGFALGAQRMRYSSLLSIVFGNASLVGLGLTYGHDPVLVASFGGLSALVLLYALNGHRRRRNLNEWDSEGHMQGDEAI